MERINAYENLRGLVYTPFYLGIAEGLFAAAGVELNATLSPSGAETAAGVAAGRVDVSWGGPMRVMAAHDTAHGSEGSSDLVCFGLAVERDPFLVIAATPDADFSPARLVGRRLDVATLAPTPWLLLQEDVRRLGFDPAAIERKDGVEPLDAFRRLSAGAVDYVLAFEPWGSHAERSGDGHVVSAGARRGPLAFTSFYAPRRFIDERPTAAKALVQGLAAALQRVREIAPEDAAAKIRPWFEDVDPALLAAAVARYQRLGIWPATPEMTADGFARLKSSLISGGFISGDPSFERLVVNP